MKKKNKEENEFTPYLKELISHKYSDFYEGFMLYDSGVVNYPVYKTKIQYTTKKEQELHKIILGVLRIIDYLQTIKTSDRYSLLLEITQSDIEILSSILAYLQVKGYLKQEEELALTLSGKKVLEQEKEEIIEEHTAYLIIDGIFGSAEYEEVDSNNLKRQNQIDKDDFEFKINPKSRPRIEDLDKIFEGDKTLRQVITEALIIGHKHQENLTIEEIIQIAPNKLFGQYICLFYKDATANERLLVLNKEHIIDEEVTKLFDQLLDTGKFNEQLNTKTKSFEKNIDEFEKATPEKVNAFCSFDIDLNAGKTIEVMEHKKYFQYVFSHAKKEIYIQSPWVKYDVLKEYKEDIENAIARGVKIVIKYGMKPRNRFDKESIDKESLSFFRKLDKNFFKFIESYDHSKIVICDDDFMIMGSFNWFSFGGGKNGKDVRGETSTINTNKEEIKKQKLKFLN